MTCAALVTYRLAMPIMALAGKNTARRRRKVDSEVGDVSHRSVACRYGAKADRCSRRLRRRHAVSARHRGPAFVDVARTHPEERLEGGRRSGRGGPSRRNQRHGRRAGGGADRGGRLRLLRGAGPVVATAGRRGVAPGRHRRHAHRRTNDQLLRADGAAHPSPHTGSRPRRGVDPQAARGPGRIPCAAVHTGDQRRVQPGLAALPQARLHRRHPRLSLRGRPPPLRDSRPVTATLNARIWHDDLVSNRRRIRLLAIVVLLMIRPVAVGCVRVRASITVSPDDRVSGQIVAAAKPRGAEDKGPQLLNSLPFSNKVAVSDYDRDDYVGSQAVFSDLTFAELPQLANMNRDAAGVDISLRRAGDLVILDGRADLTSLTDPDADVSLSVSFPGEVTSTNGAQVAAEVVERKPKTCRVTTMSAQARYTDPSARSFTGAAIWLGLASFLVAGILAALAWVNRDQSPRFADPAASSRG